MLFARREDGAQFRADREHARLQEVPDRLLGEAGERLPADVLRMEESETRAKQIVELRGLTIERADLWLGEHQPGQDSVCPTPIAREEAVFVARRGLDPGLAKIVTRDWQEIGQRKEGVAPAGYWARGGHDNRAEKAREVEHLARVGLTLKRIAGEQIRWGHALQHKPELPGQIVGIA